MPPKLDALPLFSKADFQTRFSELNPARIPLEQASTVARQAEQSRDFRPELPGGISAGLSSGTSGRPQVFLVDRADRCRWAGRILGRMISGESLRRVLNPFAAPLRIAFLLRAGGNLYDTLGSRRVDFRHGDLTRPFPDLLTEIAAWHPHVLVAPATVLAEIAREARQRWPDLRPSQVISVAEVLDPRDRRLIEKAFGVRVAEVYQAAEGLLGTSCAAGRVHLHESDLHIEPEWIDDRRFHPIITDFSRRAQWFVRHRSTDILRIAETPCPCGDPSLALEAIDGRAEETLWQPDRSGQLAPLFPDVIRQAIYAMPSPPRRYRIEQSGMQWTLRIDPDSAADRSAFTSALGHMLQRLALTPPEFHFLPWIDQAPSEKQKRLRCLARPT